MSAKDVKLGQLLVGGETRDAVHVAIFPAFSNEQLEPGMPVTLVNSETGEVRKAKKGDKRIGIVDPFLKALYPKDKFYVVLYPNTVTSMNHHWLHPAFDMKPAQEDVRKVVARQVLQNFADDLGTDLDTLLYRAKNYWENSQYWCEGGRFECGVDMPSNFWECYYIVTNTIPNENNEGYFFTCAC